MESTLSPLPDRRISVARSCKYSSESNLKKVTLELGGKNPSVVLSDAVHLDAVAEHVVNACFWNMGQNCTSNSRLIVHKDLKETLVEKILIKVREWRTGDPLEPSNRFGSMVSKRTFQPGHAVHRDR